MTCCPIMFFKGGGGGGGGEGVQAKLQNFTVLRHILL